MIYLPNDTHRISILGSTGSGKSRAAVWHLSTRTFNRPWIIFNHKKEELVDSIPYAVLVDDLKWFPKTKGIYIYSPVPESDDDERVTQLLYKVYEREKTGVYIDEGTMINPRDKFLRALYTQGRSKKNPSITLSQRPFDISRYSLSEAEFIQVFRLNADDDRKTINKWLPINLNNFMGPSPATPLPEFHSIYYDATRNKTSIFKPVPSDDILLETFERKLGPIGKTNRTFHLL